MRTNVSSLPRQNTEFSQKACAAFKLYHFTDNCREKQMGLPFIQRRPICFNIKYKRIKLFPYNLPI